MGNVIPTFRGKILSSFPVFEVSYKTFRPLNMGTLHCLKNLAPEYQLTHRHIKEEWKPQSSLCKNLKTR